MMNMTVDNCTEEAIVAKDPDRNKTDLSAEEIIEEILRNDAACYLSEIYGLLKHSYGVNGVYKEDVSRILHSWKDEIVWEQVDYGARRPATFVSLRGVFDEDAIVARSAEKSSSLRKITSLRFYTGHYLEDEVAIALEEEGGLDVEPRKESFNDVSLDGYDIDVFARHPEGYYLNIQCNNMKSEVSLREYTDIDSKNDKTRREWEIDIRPVLVCSFLAQSVSIQNPPYGIPTIETRTVFVRDEDYASYEEHMRLTKTHIYAKFVEKDHQKMRIDIRSAISSPRSGVLSSRAQLMY